MSEANKVDLAEEVGLINEARTNPEAFGLLYERYVAKIYNYVYFRVGNINDAEDLTAKVFFRALKSIGNYKHLGLPFSAWLYRIAHNLVANHYRDRSKTSEVSIDDLVVPDTRKAVDPEAILATKQDNTYLLQLINDLTPQKRELIILKFVHKLSNAEIGVIFGKTEGAIKSLYHRTLTELKDQARKDGKTRIH